MNSKVLRNERVLNKGKIEKGTTASLSHCPKLFRGGQTCVNEAHWRMLSNTLKISI